ncbi:MAG: signal peptidase I [Myxococcota bacterium]
MSLSAEPTSGLPETPERAEGSSWRGIGEQLQTLAIAVLLALAIRAFLIEPYRIPSESMLPTLMVGDHLFVNKFVYGVPLPFVDRRLPGLRAPERGDVVVFSVAKDGYEIHPTDQRPELPRESFVKRIVGVPGDRIEVRGETVLRNGEPLSQERTGETLHDEVGRQLQVVREAVGERQYRVAYDAERPGLAGEFLVEPGRYFVMGDNRDDSNDSRKWGTVREEDLKGPAFLLYWSWDWNGGWSELLSPATWWTLLSERMRWARIGDSIR